MLIEAPIDVVWEVISRPEQIVHWFSDKAELDLRPGGEGVLSFEMKATNQPAATRLAAIASPARAGPLSTACFTSAEADVQPVPGTQVSSAGTSDELWLTIEYRASALTVSVTGASILAAEP